MSAIDIALDMLRSEVGVYAPYEPDPVETARAELSSLRQRVEDLELMLREAGDGWLRRMGPSGKEPWERRWILSTSDGEIVMPPEEDGLPALTPEAREELRKR